MEYPQYWYEDQVCRVTAAFPMIYQNIFGAQYWNELTFENTRNTHLVLTGMSVIMYAIVLIGFYLTWTGLGYYPPLAMCAHFCGASVILTMNALMWSRYVVVMGQ